MVLADVFPEHLHDLCRPRGYHQPQGFFVQLLPSGVLWNLVFSRAIPSSASMLSGLRSRAICIDRSPPRIRKLLPMP